MALLYDLCSGIEDLVPNRTFTFRSNCEKLPWSNTEVEVRSASTYRFRFIYACEAAMFSEDGENGFEGFQFESFGQRYAPLNLVLRKTKDGFEYYTRNPLHVISVLSDDPEHDQCLEFFRNIRAFCLRTPRPFPALELLSA